jgi:hypothetical protein
MRLRSAVFAALLVPVFVTGCKKTSGTGAAKEDMTLVPREADIVVMANLTRMRNTDMWRRLQDLRDSDANNKKEYDDFVKRCQLDPMKDIDSVFLAFPQTGGQKDFAAVMRGKFDEDKLVACAKEQAKKDGSDVQTSDYNGKKLYTDGKKQEAWATFLDKSTVAVGSQTWVKKVIDQAGGKGQGSAKDNEALMSLVKRAKTNDGIWGAGVVPQSARDQLKADPHLAAASSMKDVFGSVDFAKGIAADANVDLATENDAKEVAAKATAQLLEAKKNPQLMMMGMASFLDAVKIDAKGSTFHLTVDLTQQQVDDLINRVKGILKSFGGALGGGGPPGGPQ